MSFYKSLKIIELFTNKGGRFDYVEPNWVSLRTKHKLALLLKDEVAQAVGKEVDEIDLGGLDEE